MSYLTAEGVRRAVTRTFEIALKDKGPPVVIVVIRADHAIVDVCSMDGVGPSEWKRAEAVARTAMNEECYTFDLENEGRMYDSCSPWYFSAISGGVILRAGKDGAVVGAVGVSGRSSHNVIKPRFNDRGDIISPMGLAGCELEGTVEEIAGQNHELALACAEAIPNCHPVSKLEDYLTLTRKGEHGEPAIIKGDWEVP